MNNTNRHYIESLYRAINFIEENLDKKILLKDIAKEALISEYHFHRIFKNLTGETVKEYLLRLKIEKASLHLKYTNKDIRQIAFESGFENHETFSRAFKRNFELSPSEFRNSIKEKLKQSKREFHEKSANVTLLKIEKPKIEFISDLEIAYIRHTGSYKKVGSAFQKIMLWAAFKLALKSKPETLGIVHDNPEITDEGKIRFDACVVINKPIRPKGEIGYKKIQGGKYATFRFIGASDEFNEVYNYIYNVCLFEYEWEFDDKPVIECYKRISPFCKPNNCITDFWVPIK